MASWKTKAGSWICLAAVIMSSLMPSSALAVIDRDFFSGNNIIYYDPESSDCSPYDGTSINTEGGTGTDTIWNSGLSAPYILEQFVIEVLKNVATKRGVDISNAVTEEHVIALIAFAYGEGGDIANRSIFNPFNSGHYNADLIDGEARGDGLQAFKSFDAGVEATARTMVNKYQNRLAHILTQKDSTAEEFMQTLTYYRKYEGNLYWAGASESDPEGYYKKELGYLKDTRKSYANRAGLVIGTPEHEKTLKITEKSKLVYNPATDTSSEDDVTTSDYYNCGSGQLSSGGMTSIDQVLAFKRIYQNLTDDEADTYRINRYPCSGGFLANCVAFSQYFVNRYTTKYLPPNNGIAIVKDMIALGFKDGGTIPKTYAVFSAPTNHPAGHTGVVLGIDTARNKIYIGQVGCGKDITYFDDQAHIEYDLDKFTNDKYQYAYTDGFLKDGFNQ